MNRFTWIFSLFTGCALALGGCQWISGLDDLETQSADAASQGMGGMQNSSGMPESSSSGSSSSGGVPPDGITLAPPCDIADSTLELCISFDSGAALDESLYAHSTSAAGLVFYDSPFGRAAGFTEGSNISLPSDQWPLLKQFTLEAWVYLNTDLSGQMNPRVIFHSPQHISFRVDKDGKLRCGVMAVNETMLREVLSSNPLPTDQWIHLSCSFDGQNLELGQNLVEIGYGTVGLMDLTPASSTITIGEAAGSMFPSSLQGKIDHIRMHNIGYTLPGLCGLYGKLC